MAIQNRVKGMLRGLAAGDRIGGPLRMALCLCDSLVNQQKFDGNHVFETYSKWYFQSGFDTGSIAARVFQFAARGLSIPEAVLTVHQRSRNLTAGCNPMHRAMVLALVPEIPSQHLSQIAHAEAKLTHYHPLAGDVSAATVQLCRKLLAGKDIEKALTEIDTQDWLDRPLSNGGFAPDVFNAAVHFLRETDSFELALGNAIGFAGYPNYCPVVVGALAGAMYGEENIPESLLSHCLIMNKVNKFAKLFAEQWASAY